MSLKIKKLDNQEGQHSDDAIPKNNGYWIYCIVGSRGRGKSTVLLSLLKGHLKKYYDNIYFCSTTAKKDDKFKLLVKELENDEKGSKFYDTCTNAVIEEICQRLEKNIEDDELRNLIIFDDCISELPKATERNATFNRLIVGSRHFKTDIIITTQKLNKLNTIVRSNLDIITLFSTVNKKELQAYTDELNVDKDDFYLKLEEATGDNKHSFLTINFMDAKPRYYKNFDEF